MADNPPLETLALTADQRRGRVVLAALFTAWLILPINLLFSTILHSDTSQYAVVIFIASVALTFVLFYAVWIGQGWSRRLLIGWWAVALLRSIQVLLKVPDVLSGIFASLYLALFVVLVFSKSLKSFLCYQQTRNAVLRARHRWRILATMAGILVVATAVVAIAYVRVRNRLPESFNQRLAALKRSGVPVTLAECDRQYRALGSDPLAVKHFQKAFAAMSKEEPPLMGPRHIAQLKPRPALPRFSEMSSPEKRALVASCLQSNAEALRLFHEGVSYRRCLFPMKLADGFQALLPHLAQSARGAHLLALESIEKNYNGDEAKATHSLLASLHMAEILQNEPNLIGVVIRDKILLTGCISLQTSLNVALIPTQDLELISDRLLEIMGMSEKGLRTALVIERCMGLSIFQGSNQQIADFLQQGEAGLGIKLSVEMTRALGVLQRDAAWFVDCIDRIEVSITNTSPERMVGELADIAFEVEQNRHLVPHHETRVNIISCMLLPGLLRAIQMHLWTQTLGEITVATIAMERYRQEVGQMPPNLDALVPQYLTKIPEDSTGQSLGFRLLPKGYAVYARGPGGREDRSNPTTEKRGSDSDAIVFKVER